MTTRREFSLEGVAAAALALMLEAKQSPAHGQSSPPSAGLAGLTRTFAAIKAESRGRLGVAVLDTGSGASAGHRADERFPMCSTFKLLAAAAVLARASAGQEQLTRRINIEQKDILAYAPVTKQHIGGAMPVAALCEAAITLSDNTAANLLLESLGGPMAITAYARSLGDEHTRLDRVEPDLNEAEPGDPRDTTTPAAMAKNLMLLSTGAALPVSSRDQLNGWL